MTQHINNIVDSIDDLDVEVLFDKNPEGASASGEIYFTVCSDMPRIVIQFKVGMMAVALSGEVEIMSYLAKLHPESEIKIDGDCIKELWDRAEADIRLSEYLARN